MNIYEAYLSMIVNALDMALEPPAKEPLPEPEPEEQEELP